jgi:hypothetical protein
MTQILYAHMRKKKKRKEKPITEKGWWSSSRVPV